VAQATVKGLVHHVFLEKRLVALVVVTLGCATRLMTQEAVTAEGLELVLLLQVLLLQVRFILSDLQSDNMHILFQCGKVLVPFWHTLPTKFA